MAAKNTAKKSGGKGHTARVVHGEAFDPSANVQALNDASSQRQDDLRDLTKELFETKIAHGKELGAIREQHQKELRVAEAQRLDSIRQVDREDVNKTAAQALSAIQTLATTTNTTAETLRTQVATTAAAAANQLGAITAEINKRLSALELSASGAAGKQAFADPQMLELIADLKSMRGTTQQGTDNTTKFLTAGLGVVATLFTIGSILVGLVLFLNRSTTATVPAPAGTTLTAPR